ncbi:MAG: hypothetical protein JKX73_05560, partial [Flavobacteriales bacterium]|nr:hypothetical protein [Flavobacteriales bacterium]
MMKKACLPLLISMLLPVAMFATHLVGGELSHRCLGGNQYEITLKLYRDCFNGIPPFPDPVEIQLFNGDDGMYTGIQFDIAFPGSVVLPLVVGNICFVPPTDVCVEEAIYIDTVTILPQIGGYDIIWNYCCRNVTIDNIVDPSNQESTYITNIEYQIKSDSAGFNGALIDAEGGNCGGNSGWTPLSSTVTTSDNIYDSIVVNNMSNGQTSCYLEATDYGFNIPASAIITGIEVEIEKRTNAVIGSIQDSSVRIILGGTVQGVGSDHSNTANWPITDSIFTYGGPGDLWGTAWTAADINANNFGVAIQPLYSRTPIWYEDFQDRTVGDEVDVGATAWSTTCAAGPAPPNQCGLNDFFLSDYFQVRNNGGDFVYEGRDMDAEAVWTSESINIAAYPLGVNISMELYEISYDNGADYVEAYYKLDGGAEIALTNGIQSGGFNNATATATALIGTTLEIVVRVNNTNGSDFGGFDDVQVSA